MHVCTLDLPPALEAQINDALNHVVVGAKRVHDPRKADVIITAANRRTPEGLGRMLIGSQTKPHILFICPRDGVRAHQQAALTAPALPSTVYFVAEGPGALDAASNLVRRAARRDRLRMAAGSDLHGPVPRRPMNRPPGGRLSHMAASPRHTRLAAMHAELEHAQAQAKLGSWTFHLEDGTWECSTQTRRILGLDIDAPLTESAYLSATHPDDRERVGTTLKAVIAGRRTRWTHRLHPNRGATPVVALHARPVLGPDGATLHVKGTIQDVTELIAQKQRIQEVARQSKEKERFIQTMAHELNTPLTAIRMQLAVAQKVAAIEGGPRIDRSLTVVDRNFQRLEALMQDLLDGMRLEEGRLPIVLGPVRLDRLVRQCAEDMAEVAAGAKVALDVRASPGDYCMKGDARRLMQVLHNLLGNAVKYGREGGHVTVVLQREGGRIKMEVRDDGIGIQPEAHERLFQPFSRVHDESTHCADGSGLGLFICKGIIEGHKGTLTARSDGVGCGSTFEVLLPVTDDGRPPTCPT